MNNPTDSTQSTSRLERRFDFAQDAFSFANELVWEYQSPQPGGRAITTRREPPPTFAHRCFGLVRVARQFFYHAHFAPEKPPVDLGIYRSLIRQVLSRNPRRISSTAAQVVIPGFSGLRAFSQTHEPLLKAACGGAWRSYVLRSHWRMLLPFSRPHQSATCNRLRWALQEQARLPIVHLVRFPQLTINHGILLYAVEESATERRFAAYDPNCPEHPRELCFQPGTRTFTLPSSNYWPGGRVDVMEIIYHWLF